jgi:hypothetical protein
MGRKDEGGGTEDRDALVRRLRAERPQLAPLELDRLKQSVLSQGRSHSTKGANLKGRIAIAVLSLGLMGAGAGGVVAASGGSAGGASSAQSQYVHCGKGTHRVGNHCVSNGNPHGCGKGTHWDPKTMKCVAIGTKGKHFCGKGTHWDPKSHTCVANPQPNQCHKGFHQHNGKCVKNGGPNGKGNNGHHHGNGGNGNGNSGKTCGKDPDHDGDPGSDTHGCRDKDHDGDPGDLALKVHGFTG